MKVHFSKERRTAMSTILIHVTDQTHTVAALRTACELACNNQHDIVLLKLIPVMHPGWLGTDDWGYMNLTSKDQEALLDYQRYAEKRGVQVEVCCMQSISTVDALIEAVENANVQIVFAHLPHTIIPFLRYWHRKLQHRLEQHQCQLYLSDSTATFMPTTMTQPSAIH